MGKKLFRVATFFYCISLGISFAAEISLASLDCSEAAVIGSNVGIRPYRKGGIRLEKENLDNKAIFHNYGHGGTGATLAPGCVQKVISLFNQEEPEKTKSISVIGAGYMGLMTAHQLADDGYQVKLYAEKFPENDYFYQKNKPCITSLVGGGLWLPFGIDRGEDQVLFKSLQTSSFNYYKQKTETANTYGVSFRHAYSIPSQNISQFPEELEPPKTVEVKFGNQRYSQASKWSTIHIDGNIFINGLYTTAKEKRITFKQKKFSTIEEVLSLPDTYIFNCTGYGSKYLFNDEALKPIRGQLLYLKPQPSFDFFLFGKGSFGPFAVYPSSDKISIGLTYEEGIEALEVEPATLEQMRQNVASFFGDN